jgi:hypothetical protein
LYLNFFHQGSDSLNLAQLFDYVRVPSKFAGTVAGWTEDDPKKPMYSMREPGKVNINTLNAETWKKLKGERTYAEDTENRLPFNAVKNTVEGTQPSEFKAFRSPGAAKLVPPLKSEEVAQSSLFDLVEPDDDTKTNPYTALEKTMRLSALTTNRSNVFAVWITVGYFNAEKFDTVAKLQERYPSELEHITNAAVFKAVYPDGCVLGSEKGLDNGTVGRHRSFYLIDRSIPAGFRRGEMLNSRNVIVKRTELD